VRTISWIWCRDCFQWEGGEELAERSSSHPEAQTALMLVPHKPGWAGTDPAPPATSTGLKVEKYRVPRG
jgi:hypothetical protein